MKHICLLAQGVKQYEWNCGKNKFIALIFHGGFLHIDFFDNFSIEFRLAIICI